MDIHVYLCFWWLITNIQLTDDGSLCLTIVHKVEFVQCDNLSGISKWQSRLIFGDHDSGPYQSGKAGSSKDATKHSYITWSNALLLYAVMGHKSANNMVLPNEAVHLAYLESVAMHIYLYETPLNNWNINDCPHTQFIYNKLKVQTLIKVTQVGR